MGIFDTIKSYGQKALGAIESVGSKGIRDAVSIGQKASDFGHKALANPAVQGFLTANPELGGIAGGALAALDVGLQVGKTVGDVVQKGEESGILKKREQPKMPAAMPNKIVSELKRRESEPRRPVTQPERMVLSAPLVAGRQPIGTQARQAGPLARNISRIPQHRRSVPPGVRDVMSLGQDPRDNQRVARPPLRNVRR
jgi:hypothetical protein